MVTVGKKVMQHDAVGALCLLGSLPEKAVRGRRCHVVCRTMTASAFPRLTHVEVLYLFFVESWVYDGDHY